MYFRIRILKNDKIEVTNLKITTGPACACESVGQPPRFAAHSRRMYATTNKSALYHDAIDETEQKRVIALI